MSHRLLVILVLALCAASVYGPTFSGPYLSDDYWLIANADNTRQPWSFFANLVTPLPEDYEPRIYRELWRASYALDDELFGLNAAISRLFNALLHVGNGFLLFLLYVKLLGDRTSAVLAAALFTVFPAHLSAVAWIAARCDLLAVFFSLCALNLYAISRDSELGRRGKIGIGACVFLAIQSKETGLIAVPALCALHWSFSPRAPLRARLHDLWINTWWLWAWLAINLAMRFWVVGTLVSGYRRESSFGVDSFLEQLGRIATGLALPSIDTVGPPSVLLAGVIGIGLAVLFFALRTSGEKAAQTCRFTIVWLALTALPLSTLGDVASRHFYQPAAAWCPLVVILVYWMGRSLWAGDRVWIRATLCGSLIGLSWLVARDAIRPYREGGEIGRELFTQARSILVANGSRPVVLYDFPNQVGPCYVGGNAFPGAFSPPFEAPRNERFVGVSDNRTLQPNQEQALVSIALRTDSLYFKWDPDARAFRAAVPPSLPGSVRGRLTVSEDGGFTLEPASIRAEGDSGTLLPLVDQFVTLEGERVGSSNPPVLRVTDARASTPMLIVTDTGRATDSITLSITGEPGDHVFLGISAKPGFFAIGTAGTLLLDKPIPWEDLHVPPEGTTDITLGTQGFQQSGALLVQAVINREGEWHIGDFVIVEIEE